MDRRTARSWVREMPVQVMKWIGVVLLALTVVTLLALTIVPRFLDRIYYRGPVSDHFDGARFFNPDGEDTGPPQPPGGGGSRGGFLWRQLTGNDGRPAWPTTVAVTPSKPAARVDGEAMVVTWIGHATLLIQTQGLNILTDPVYAEQAGPFGLGPRRVARPGVAFADLPRIDLVLVSHNHYDHMDLTTLKRLWDRDRPMVVTSLGNDAILRGAGIAAVAGDWGQTIPVIPPCREVGTADCNTTSGVPGVAIHVTRNHHWGSRWFADRNRALWSSFVIALPGGNIFFAGDTGMGDGQWIEAAAALGPIRFAAIPIGAFRFSPGEMGTGSHFGPVDAVEVFRRLGAATALPIHWGTFRLSYEGYDTPPRLLAAAMACTRQPGTFAAVPIGQATAIPAMTARPVPALPVMTRETLLRCLDTPAVRALR